MPETFISLSYSADPHSQALAFVINTKRQNKDISLFCYTNTGKHY